MITVSLVVLLFVVVPVGFGPETVDQLVPKALAFSTEQCCLDSREAAWMRMPSSSLSIPTRRGFAAAIVFDTVDRLDLLGSSSPPASSRSCCKHVGPKRDVHEDRLVNMKHVY